MGEYMARFEERYRLAELRQGARILAIPAAHHRFNYIHPFPDGNGRVSRLMSHAMGYLPASPRMGSGRSHAGSRAV